MISAAGGALDDAALVVNVFIALGTVGAASVALWLDLRARGDAARNTEDARRISRRQVIAVYRPRPAPPVDSPARVEVVNGSSEVINTVRVQVFFQPWASGANNTSATWVGSGEGFAPYLLSGSMHAEQGDFRPLDLHSRVDMTSTVLTEFPHSTVRIQLTWIDSRGLYWARNNSEEPYETDGAKPGRDVAQYRDPPVGRLTRLRRKFRLGR